MRNMKIKDLKEKLDTIKSKFLQTRSYATR